MNRSFENSRPSANGADADRGTARTDEMRGERERDYGERDQEEERWRQQYHRQRSYPQGAYGYYGEQGPRGYEPAREYGERAELERERMDRMRYELGAGALPSAYGNLPNDPMRHAGPWRGRDEEYNFWGQSRHPHAHAQGHPSLWDRVKGVFTGRGPKNYTRSDDRIREDVCEHLFDHPYIDASEIEVHVADGEVTLTGLVDARIVKRAAEDCAEHVRGVKDVHNQLRVKSPG